LNQALKLVAAKVAARPSATLQDMTTAPHRQTLEHCSEKTKNVGSVGMLVTSEQSVNEYLARRFSMTRTGEKTKRQEDESV
jgi:hypothetical protein